MSVQSTVLAATEARFDSLHQQLEALAQTSQKGKAEEQDPWKATFEKRFEDLVSPHPLSP